MILSHLFQELLDIYEESDDNRRKDKRKNSEDNRTFLSTPIYTLE